MRVWLLLNSRGPRSLDLGAIRWLMPYFGRARGAWALAAVATVIASVTEPLVPAMLKPLLDRGFQQDSIPLWMVPASLPARALLVTATGLLEFIGAVGLLVPQARPAAAYGLMALLVAMFPANVHAARQRLAIAGRGAMPVVWRLPLQVFWIAALWWVRSSTPSL